MLKSSKCRLNFPRAKTWDALLTATGASGIHYEDYPEMQGLELPEWSHLSRVDAERFTEALYRIVEHDFWHRCDSAEMLAAGNAPHHSLRVPPDQSSSPR